jgi:hypothetical protein
MYTNPHIYLFIYIYIPSLLVALLSKKYAHSLSAIDMGVSRDESGEVSSSGYLYTIHLDMSLSPKDKLKYLLSQTHVCIKYIIYVPN